jgi:hypothetical protein
MRNQGNYSGQVMFCWHAVFHSFGRSDPKVLVRFDLLFLS